MNSQEQPQWKEMMMNSYLYSQNYNIVGIFFRNEQYSVVDFVIFDEEKDFPTLEQAKQFAEQLWRNGITNEQR